MRRQLPILRTLVPVKGGYVVREENNGKGEYLGSDKLWHRFAEQCDPFTDEATAAAVKQQLEGGN